MEGMNGLLLVEGEDVEPKRFEARRANFQYLEKTHPLKDEIEIRLIRHALRQRLPILGICRGSQLDQCGLRRNALRRRAEGKEVRRSSTSIISHYDTYRHPVTIAPGTPLAKWYREARHSREQLPSSGHSRLGAALQAHGPRRRMA